MIGPPSVHTFGFMPSCLKSRFYSQGAVLILALAVLALLSLMGTALIFMTREALRQTMVWVDQGRADLVAESGIEYAMAKIKHFKGGLVELNQAIAYESKYPQFRETRMEHLKRPSFAQVDTDGDGIKDVSGVVSETYSQRGDIYKLRINSSAALLNINDSNSPINYDSDPWEDQITPNRDLADNSLLIDTMRPPNGKDPDWIYPDDEDFDNTTGHGKPYPNPEAAPNTYQDQESES